MEIRPFRNEDWPAIGQIVKLIWNIGLDYLREKRYGFEVGGKPWYQRKAEDLRQEIRANPGDWYVTEVDGRVIGFCGLSIDPSTAIGKVGGNGIHPDYKGKGYGRGQLRFILDELRRRGMKIAEVHTALNDGHAAARKMYERAGFEPIMDSRMYTLEL